MKAVLLALILPVAAFAQNQAPDPQDLADIRADLAALDAEIETLRQLIIAESSQSGIGAGIGPAILRLDRLEAELRLVNGRVEQIGNHIEKVVIDGTRRIGDLEFRLTELEGGDIAALGDTPRLGEGNTDGKVPMEPAPPPRRKGNAALQTVPDAGAADPQDSAGAETDPAPATPEIALAVSEKSDYEKAMQAFDTGEMAQSVILFGSFLSDFPGGPLSVEALFHLGAAQTQLGQHREAARSYLDTFTAAPKGVRAPMALLRVGTSLGHLNQIPQACQTLAEVLARYPDHAVASEARSSRETLNCG